MDRTLRGDDRVVKLLSALVVLTALLVLGVAAGGVVLWREYRALRVSVQAVAGGEGASLREAAMEISERQQRADRELVALTREAARELSDFERRGEELRHQGGGPVAAASRAVELTQLMSDELILQLKLMTALHGVVEKVVRPIEPERAQPSGGDEAGHRAARRGPEPAGRR